MQMHVCSFHSQVSFPSDSWSNEVNNDNKEGPEVGLRSSDLPVLRQHLRPFLPVVTISALQDRSLSLKDTGKQREVYVRVCVHFPACTSRLRMCFLVCSLVPGLVKVLSSGVCVWQHVHLQILGMKSDLVL